MEGSDRFVRLKNGPTVPVEPIALSLELEERGFTLERMADGILSVEPHERLTRDDYPASRSGSSTFSRSSITRRRRFING